MTVPSRIPGPLTDIAALERYLRGFRAHVAVDSVGIDQLQDEVVTTPKVAGASAAANGSFYVKRSDALIFGPISDADLPTSIARDSEVAAAQTAAIDTALDALADHVADADPHPQYLLTAEANLLYAPIGAVRAIAFADSPYTPVSTDSVIVVNASGGAVTINLPVLASSSNRRLTVKKTDASGNAVTIDGAGAETIDGAATQAISTQYGVLRIVGGSEWHII